MHKERPCNFWVHLSLFFRVRAHTAAHAGKDEEAAKAFVTARGTGIGRQSHCCHRPGLIDFRGPNLPDLQAGRDGDEESKGPWCSQRGQKGAALPNTDLTPIHSQYSKLILTKITFWVNPILVAFMDITIIAFRGTEIIWIAKPVECHLSFQMLPPLLIWYPIPKVQQN